MRRALLPLLAACVAACVTNGGNAVAAQTIATGLHVPWGVAFLPNGKALVAERTTGRIICVRRGHRMKVAMRVPGVNTASGEGGLLGLAVSPHYRRDHWVYAYFTTTTDNRIARFHLGGRLHPILTGLRRGMIHNGGRIAFGPDGKLYAGVGETGLRGIAQDLGSLNGKILRINPNGSIPRGNPFRGSPVWSYGHRNVEGLAWDGEGRLWEVELGQDRFDEVNLIHKGRNYGWPVVEGVGNPDGGRFVNPKLTWPTDEASPAGAAIDRGVLYVGALQGRGVWRVPLHGTRVGHARLLFRGRYGRVRTIVDAPDGSLWLTTSDRDGHIAPRRGDDRVVRFMP